VSARIETLITELVRAAPTRDASVIAALRDELHAVATPLALAIARAVELVDEDLVDPGIALPALAEACATLVAGLAGRLDAAVLATAQFQIETLTPVPDRPPSLTVAPDVPVSSLTALSRGRRPRT